MRLKKPHKKPCVNPLISVGKQHMTLPPPVPPVNCSSSLCGFRSSTVAGFSIALCHGLLRQNPNSHISEAGETRLRCHKINSVTFEDFFSLEGRPIIFSSRPAISVPAGRVKYNRVGASGCPRSGCAAPLKRAPSVKCWF